MATVLHLLKGRAEPTIVIKWSGVPAVWRWQGRVFDLALLHAHWVDEQGHDWYRVESTEGLIFLLGRGSSGWTAVRWPSPAGPDRLAAI